jgi:hypothetical protein
MPSYTFELLLISWKGSCCGKEIIERILVNLRVFFCKKSEKIGVNNIRVIEAGQSALSHASERIFSISADFFYWDHVEALQGLAAHA